MELLHVRGLHKIHSGAATCETVTQRFHNGAATCKTITGEIPQQAVTCASHTRDFTMELVHVRLLSQL